MTAKEVPLQITIELTPKVVLPQLTLLEAYILEEQRRRTHLDDEKAVILSEYLRHPLRTQASTSYRDSNKRVESAVWFWGLLRKVVMAQTDATYAEKRNMMKLSLKTVNVLAKTVLSLRTNVKKGGQKPPMPAPIPPPFVDPAQAFQDLVTYQRKVKDHLNTRWHEEPQRSKSIGGHHAKFTPRSVPHIPPIPVQERELITARTKHKREKDFSKYVRAKVGKSKSALCSKPFPPLVIAKTESNHRAIHVVDYSFANLETLENILKVEPKGMLVTNEESQEKEVIKDDDSSEEDALAKTWRPVGQIGIIQTKDRFGNAVKYVYKQEERTKMYDPAETKEEVDLSPTVNLKRYAGQRLNLSNNQLSNVDELPLLLPKKAVCAESMIFIDLSHNHLVEIPQCLEFFTCLTTLHFHSNRIKELHGLRYVPLLSRTLTDITLHGNPIDEASGTQVRHVILAVLPKLKMLNYSCVLETDRDKASFLLRAHKSNKGQLFV